MPSLTAVDMMSRTTMAAPKKKNWVKKAVPKERRSETLSDTGRKRKNKSPLYDRKD